MRVCPTFDDVHDDDAADFGQHAAIRDVDDHSAAHAVGGTALKKTLSAVAETAPSEPGAQPDLWPARNRSGIAAP